MELYIRMVAQLIGAHGRTSAHPVTNVSRA